MPGDRRRKNIGADPKVFVLPEIAYLAGAVKSHIAKLNRHGCAGIARVFLILQIKECDVFVRTSRHIGDPSHLAIQIKELPVAAAVLIDSHGRIAQVWRKVRIAGHAEQVLEAARAL